MCLTNRAGNQVSPQMLISEIRTIQDDEFRMSTCTSYHSVEAVWTRAVLAFGGGPFH